MRTGRGQRQGTERDGMGEEDDEGESRAGRQKDRRVGRQEDGRTRELGEKGQEDRAVSHL